VARTYRESLVCQQAKALAVAVYHINPQFPRHETYGLTSQLRRAAVSVASKIAEGQARLTRGEFLNFLAQAGGWLLELDTQLAIALDPSCLNASQYDIVDRELDQARGLLSRLNDSLRQA
jgi:four helix bundle protein